MPLNIAIDTIYISQSKIVLSGTRAKSSIDAAMFLTTLRVACEGDLYFSLDPDDGALWMRQGQLAFDNIWSHIAQDFDAKSSNVGVQIRTISARRDHSNLWGKLAPTYPNFRSRLVFSPSWLRETRVGEILYKSDLLLKELSSGIPLIEHSSLRASRVQGYLSADTERAAKLLASVHAKKDIPQKEWRGSRLWFDLLPAQPVGLSRNIAAQADTKSLLGPILRARGLIRRPLQVSQPPVIIDDGAVTDLSLIRPQMFVRIHDPVSNRDLADHDPDLDGLANDVSIRFEEYASVYPELQMLREIFRSWVAAAQIASKRSDICNRVAKLPLLDFEKITSLPEYHPSELFITVATYRPLARPSAQVRVVASSINGGVSISGESFLERNLQFGQTEITKSVHQEVELGDRVESGNGEKVRVFLRFLAEDLFAPAVIAGSQERQDIEIENEPAAAALPR